MSVPFDSERFEAVRAAFPLLQRRAYLFAGGMAPLSTPSREALEGYADLCASDPVTAYRDVPVAEEAQLRRTIAPFVGAQPEDIAILDSTSRGNNLAVQILEAPPGSNVVVDSTTYPSALYPWLLDARSHVELRRVSDARGLPALDDFARLVDGGTVAISVSHVCRLTGFRHDLAGLADLAHANGARLLVDAAQSAGAVSIDVKRDAVDAMAFGAMKWLLGRPGVAFFYVCPSVREQSPLVQGGLRGAAVAADGQLKPSPGARRFELGSGSWGGLAASRRGAELLAEIPAEEIERGVVALSGQLVEGLLERQIDVRTPTEAGRRAGVVAFAHDRPEALCRHLKALGIDVWAWEDRRLVRADPHVYNVPEDVERLLGGIDSFHS